MCLTLREHPVGRGKARLTLSSVECLGGFLSFVDLWVLGLGLRAWAWAWV